LLFFSPPIALGVASIAEYVTVDIKNISPNDFLLAFNKAAPEGIVGLKAFYTEKSPNLAGQVVISDYEFPIKSAEDTAKILAFFTNCKEYVLKFKQKGVLTEKEVSSQILSVRCYNKGLIFALATGNDNLRADRFLSNLQADFNIDTNIFDIRKTTQYVRTEKGLAEVDFLLMGGSREKTTSN
ncbi:MAG: DUF2344 domain-containing protein, partial [Clostridia bacterium]